MNRLVIVGNGFDLAHGLPTGYCDFIDWYWKNLCEDLSAFSTLRYSDNLLSINLKFRLSSRNQAIFDFSTVKSCLEIESFIAKYEAPNYINPHSDYNNCTITYKGILFRILSTKREIENWVDVENEYYKLLKECLKSPDNSNVKELNEEFENVKKLLEKYLHEEVAKKYDFKNSEQMLRTVGIFNLKNRLSRSDSFLEEFGEADQEQLRELISNYEGWWKNNNVKTNDQTKNLFLNFNYTPTIDNYWHLMNTANRDNYGESEVIQIHGILKDNDNPINFGFGDEMDDEYKTIEKKDDNEYLRNIKSFQYLQNSNYKRMLSFVESQPFQVYIMGHSCGLSDRILLNKIFEHTNCRSIKVFYYKKGDWDNYTDIVQNISRHFNKKEMMREKIVNKTLCEPLPQIKLPLKQ